MSATGVKYEDTAGGVLPVTLRHALVKLNIEVSLEDDFYDQGIGLVSNPIVSVTVRGASSRFNFKPLTGVVTPGSPSANGFSPFPSSYTNMPVHGHDTNLLWDAGLKLIFHLGKYRTKGPSESELAAIAEAARIAAEAEAARLARIQAEQEALHRARVEEARRAEEAERAAREAAEAKERAFRTPIPTVYFANDSKQVLEEYDPGLQEALDILQRYPDFQLEIHAYCSRSGSKAYNQKLSEQRMEAIRGWFTAHGIPMERMAEAYFHGIDHNASSAAQARRAELKFIK